MRLSSTAPAVAGILFALLTFAGCTASAPSAGPTASARPSPTPVIADPGAPTGREVVGSALDAATLVVGSDPLFAGVAPRIEDAVGQDRYWVVTPLENGRFRIEVTIGWGDCQAGCIERHVWTYEVWPDGRKELVSETGPEVPRDLP